MRSPHTTSFIGVFDTVAAQHYGGLFASGFGFAASYYGLPIAGSSPGPTWSTSCNGYGWPSHTTTCSSTSTTATPTPRSPATWWSTWSASAHRRIGGDSGGPEAPQALRPRGRSAILPLEEYLAKLNLVLHTRRNLFVVPCTDASEESEILRRVAALATTDADALLVDGRAQRGMDPHSARGHW